MSANRSLVATLATLLVALAIAGGGAFVWLSARTQPLLADAPLQSGRAAATLALRQRTTALDIAAAQLAGNPGFVAYVAHALAPEPGAEPDVTSITDLLVERSGSNDLDMAGVLGPDGAPIAFVGVPVHDRVALAANPALTTARLAAVAGATLWIERDRLLLVAIVPLRGADAIEGFLIAGRLIDEALPREIADVSRADTVVLVRSPEGTRVAATSLSPDQARELLAAVQKRGLVADASTQHDAAAVPIRIASTPGVWQARIDALVGGDGAAEIVTVLAPGRDGALTRALWPPLVAVIAFSALLLIALAFVFWRKFQAPILAVLDAAEVAARGNYREPVVLAGRSSAARLSQALARLLAELRRRAPPSQRPE